MKKEYRDVINNCMPLLMKKLIINRELLYEFLPRKIFMEDNMEEILVSKYHVFLDYQDKYDINIKI